MKSCKITLCAVLLYLAIAAPGVCMTPQLSAKQATAQAALHYAYAQKATK